MKDRVDRNALTTPVGIAHVEDVNQEVGIAQLFQSRAEGVDEVFGEIGDEADGVGDADVALRRNVGAANRRIEGCERLVGDERIAAREPVEQRRFSGVRITDERNERLAAVAGAANRALPAHAFELAAQHADARADAAAIDFQLRFPGPTGADAAAQTRKVGTDADEIRLAVAQLRELDLQLPFAAARVTRKDIEDEHRPVDDRQRNDLFEILPLARAQVVEDEEQLRLERPRAIGDLARFSAADERCRIDGVAPLDDAIEDARAGRARKRFELEQLRLERPPRIVRIDRDDDGR
jgi:hypothetical protein